MCLAVLKSLSDTTEAAGILKYFVANFALGMVTCHHFQLLASTLKKNILLKELNVYCKCRLPYVLEHVKHLDDKEAT